MRQIELKTIEISIKITKNIHHIYLYLYKYIYNLRDENMYKHINWTINKSEIYLHQKFM